MDTPQADWYLIVTHKGGRSRKRGPMSIFAGLDARSKQGERLANQGYTNSTADRSVWGKGDKRVTVTLQHSSGKTY